MRYLNRQQAVNDYLNRAEQWDDYSTWISLRVMDLIDDGFTSLQAQRMAQREWNEGCEVELYDLDD